MEELPDTIDYVISLLEKVVKGELDPKEALVQWSRHVPEKGDGLVESCWHHLYHFSVDEDIRLKDSEYDKYQRGLLFDCIEKFKEAVARRSENPKES